MSRALSTFLTMCVAAGCYRSHGLSEATRDGGPIALVAEAGTTRPGEDGELARCFVPSVATAVVVGPSRECVRREIAPRPGGGCRSFAGEHLGTAVRVARRAVGRVDVRVACVSEACTLYEIGPDACDGCNEVPADATGHASPRFAASQVDGLLELVVEGGGAEVEVCFDPDYGPPPWDG